MRHLALLMLAACSPDLPAGWEDATPVASLTQSECAGNPYEAPPDERVAGDLASDPLSIEVLEAHFRCAQDVEAYWQQDGERVEVLVQPIDMNPSVVAACDCLFDLDIEVGVPTSPPERLVVYRRWDNLNDDNVPVQIGALPGE